MALATKWAETAGPGSRAEEVFGPQTVSMDFAVCAIRAAAAGQSATYEAITHPVGAR